MTSLLRDVSRTAPRPARCRSAARTSPARPARRTRTSTPGSAATTPSMVGVAWIGFDQPKTLGTNETGAVAALPIWITLHAEGAEGRAARSRLTDARGRASRARSTPRPGLRDDSGGAHRILLRRVSRRAARDGLASRRSPGAPGAGHPRPAVLGRPTMGPSASRIAAVSRRPRPSAASASARRRSRARSRRPRRG